MKQNKDREEFEKILFNFGTFYEELPQTVRGRKRALKEMDKLWKMFQSYTQKKVKEALNNIVLGKKTLKILYQEKKYEKQFSINKI